ncbi:MAG: PAS domain S-box protein [Ktedonobacteraceae bacterium]|nr:PAS domain S-box protein [Ktedonobacteraceae bacterium]
MTDIEDRKLGLDDSRYRLLVESITDYAIYFLDPTGTVSSWNAGAQRFKGYEASEIIGQNFSQFYTPEDRASGLPQRALAEASEKGSFQGEGWRVRKDGRQFWASVVIDPVRDPNGKIIGFAKITRDLTERKHAEQALRASEEQFRLLVQGVTDYAIYMLDPNGVVASWNLGAERIKGYKPDEIIGQHFSQFYSEEDRRRGEPAIALETAVREGRFEKEAVRIRQDGTPFTAHVIIDPVRDQEGSLIGFAKVTRDITERKLAQALQASESQFRSFAQSMANQVWAADNEGKLNWFSDRALTYIGLTYEQLAGDGWAKAVHPDDLPKAAMLWAAALASGALYETEFRIRSADGVYRWHLVRAVPIHDDQGEIERWVGTNTDIEEDRQIRAKLSETQSELSILLNSAASAFYSVAQDGSTTSCNAAFLNILGFSDTSKVIGKKLHDVIHHTHLDGRHFPKTECPIYLCAQNGTEAHVPEELFFRNDGTPVPVEYWVRPLFREGTLVGAICNFNDITERKQADEQRKLLIGELNHRVKNLFALVGGIVALSARTATTSKELADVLRGRFGALAQAHELIQPGLRFHDISASGDFGIKELIAKIFSPYALPQFEERIKFDGPSVAISEQAVTGMALVFHELATNAAKYGALFEPDGKIEVRWRTSDGTLYLNWIETGCQPRRSEPQHKGFGSMLVQRSVESQFGGTISNQWNSDGLSVSISVPLRRLL